MFFRSRGREARPHRDEKKDDVLSSDPIRARELLEEVDSCYLEGANELMDPIGLRLTIIPLKPSTESRLQSIELGSLVSHVLYGRDFHPLNPSLAFDLDKLKTYVVDQGYIEKRNNYLQRYGYSEKEFLNYRGLTQKEYQQLLSIYQNKNQWRNLTSVLRIVIISGISLAGIGCYFYGDGEHNLFFSYFSKCDKGRFDFLQGTFKTKTISIKKQLFSITRSAECNRFYDKYLLQKKCDDFLFIEKIDARKFFGFSPSSNLPSLITYFYHHSQGNYFYKGLQILTGLDSIFYTILTYTLWNKNHDEMDLFLGGWLNFIFLIGILVAEGSFLSSYELAKDGMCNAVVSACNYFNATNLNTTLSLVLDNRQNTCHHHVATFSEMVPEVSDSVVLKLLVKLFVPFAQAGLVAAGSSLIKKFSLFTQKQGLVGHYLERKPLDEEAPSRCVVQ